MLLQQFHAEVSLGGPFGSGDVPQSGRGQDSAQARYAELEDGPDVGLAMDEPGEEEREHEGGDLEP